MAKNPAPFQIMKRQDLTLFCCPECRGSLELHATREQSEVEEGNLTCQKCGKRFEIVRSIPRFVPMENYAASFGYQWQAFARTQVGGEQTRISRIRFDATAGWP